MAIKIAGTEVINDNKELVLAKLAEIDSSISVTAVDVFVYDTSKDSDGGAWRKRTQGTSWYNETLNTAKRGSRKEFPAVAVIVAEADTVTIYDGDDPSLPMWMVFSTISNSILRGSANDVNSAVAGEAQLLIGALDSSGLYQIDFLKDRGTRWSSANTTNTGVFHLTIAERSGIAPISIAQSPGLIVSGAVNDVAMTVLPNAPIDAATGLPVPTIAVATDGGVSVITDSGDVYDSDYTQPIKDVVFDEDYSLFYMRRASTYSLGMALISDYTSGDGFGDLIASGTVGQKDFDLLGTRQQLTTAFNKGTVVTGGFSTGTRVLGIHQLDKSNLSNVLSAGITSTYNTGWMNGDIKGAFLSDTDDTDVVGSELVTNGDFASATGWNIDSPWVISSGIASVDGSQADYVSLDQDTLSLDQTKTYVITFDVTRTAGTLFIRFGSKNSSGNLTIISASGSYVLTSVPLGGGLNTIQFLANSAFAGTVDNVTIRLAEEDRSVNGNGLQVFGTVTKSAVATGADLVAYSGFSTSNYLEQPYNSSLDFGTGDFCVMGWFKTTSTGTDMILDSRDASNTEGFYVFVNSSGNVVIGTRNVSTSTGEGTIVTNNGSWHHFCTAVKSSGKVMDVYVDGVLDTSTTVTARSITGSNDNMSIGIGYQGSFSFAGSIALLRISATAPSAEQIAKIYNDEKMLFQENAQATLYGSSDAVTALAHDDATDLLHVGTSAGRSVFQGLRRVSNTTTAVGTAISASNNLIVEE